MSLAEENKILRRCLDSARSCIQILHTWATFQFGVLPRGHTLVPAHVEDLCRKNLAKIDAALKKLEVEKGGSQ